MKSGNKDAIFLRHIIEEIKKIENSTKSLNEEGFKKDLDVQDAILRRIEVIGEAAKNVSAALKEKHAEIEWKKISGMRDIIIHAYFNVDIGLTWKIVKKDIPTLKVNIQLILRGMDAVLTDDDMEALHDAEADLKAGKAKRLV